MLGQADTLLDLDLAVAVSDQAFLHYPPRFISRLRVRRNQEIKEPLVGKFVSYGLFRASSVHFSFGPVLVAVGVQHVHRECPE